MYRSAYRICIVGHRRTQWEAIRNQEKIMEPVQRWTSSGARTQKVEYGTLAFGRLANEIVGRLQRNFGAGG